MRVEPSLAPDGKGDCRCLGPHYGRGQDKWKVTGNGMTNLTLDERR
jgi:hypothetical protein